MMILDRMTGEKLSLTQLPEELIAGRYILLEPAKVNRHTMLPKGAYIMSDGTDKLEFNQHSFSVEEPQVSKTTQDRSYWARQAIIQIAGEFHIDAVENLKELPSPLIPKDLVNTSHHDALLDLLGIAIRKGHLHIISSRPRIDMRYDDMLLPVSRAKRVATNAGQHLAAHSECWQKRTFTGIMPKKILGLVSEDEYNLYENQVFARLLDGLQKYLSKKLYNLLRLEENLAQLKKIEGSDRLFHKLIESICELWGKAHPGTENDALHLLVEEQIKTTEDYLRTVKGLKQRGLYKLVPRSAQVARQIRVTNILAHDQHYRHLVGLWQALVDAMASDNLSAAEVLQNNIDLQEAYVGYCQLVIIRSLAALKFKLTKELKHELLFDNGEINLSLKMKDGGWVVASELATLDLHFIPIAAWNTSGLKTVYTRTNIRIPCIPVNAEQLSPVEPVEWLTTQKNEPFYMSPEDFYLEEKMVVLLKTWLWSGAMLTYGKVISKLTGHFINYIEGQHAFTSLVDGHSMKIIAPVLEKDAGEFLAQLSKSGLSKNRQDEINTLVKNLRFMSTCQNCGASSTFTPWDKDCFRCHCSSCGVTWGIYHTKSHRVGKFISSKECVPGFLNNGRWNYSFDLSSFAELPEK